MAGETTAVIGPSVKLKGELSGTEPLEFHGHVEGSIDLDGARLTIGASARVHGNISASEVVVQGHVNGNILARDRVRILASAVVEGEIVAPKMSVEAGAELHAVVDLTQKEEPKPPAPPPLPPAEEPKPQAPAPSADAIPTSATTTASAPATEAGKPAATTPPKKA